MYLYLALIIRHQKAHQRGYSKATYRIDREFLHKRSSVQAVVRIIIVQVKYFLFDIFFFYVAHIMMVLMGILPLSPICSPGFRSP